MMSTEAQPTCAAGVTAATRSAWRDDALPSAMAGRLTAHFAACAACQARLARDAELAATLRAQPQPGPDGRLRDAVRARIRAERVDRTAPGAAYRRPIRVRGRRLWRGGIGALGALAAALLLVAGFAQLFRATVTHTGKPGATPMAGMLVWHAATFPAGFVVPDSATQSPATRSLDMAPGDGNTAYACMAPAQGQRTQPVIWVTHDRAAHWTERVRVPANGDATNCLIRIDLVNPSVAVVDVLEASAADELFITFDGAATWQPLAATGLTALDRVATAGGRTYALVRGRWFNGTIAQTRLVVTADHFASARAIDGAIAGQDGTDAFWINPASEALLARTASGLWQTRDGGAIWTRIALPEGVNVPAGLVVLAVQTPVADQPWHLCLDESQTTTLPDGPNSNELFCTADGGQTWNQRSGQPPTLPLVSHLSGMVLAADGAVLVALPGGEIQPTGAAVNYLLWRLPAGGDLWQSLGAVPAPNVLYAPAPGRGMLLAFASPELALESDAALLTMGSTQTAAIFTAPYD